MAETLIDLRGFLGRQKDAAHVEDMLKNSPPHRHVLVSGPAGIGKTSFLKYLWLGDIKSRVFLTFRFFDGYCQNAHAVEDRICRAILEHRRGRSPSDQASAESGTGLKRMRDQFPDVTGIILDGLDEALVAWDDASWKIWHRSGLTFVFGTRLREDIQRVFWPGSNVYELPGLSTAEIQDYFSIAQEATGSANDVEYRLSQ